MTPRDDRHGPPDGRPLVNGVKTDMVNERLIGPGGGLPASGFALVASPQRRQNAREHDQRGEFRRPGPAPPRGDDADQRRGKAEPEREAPRPKGLDGKASKREREPDP